LFVTPAERINDSTKLWNKICGGTILWEKQEGGWVMSENQRLRNEYQEVENLLALSPGGHLAKLIIIILLIVVIAILLNKKFGLRGIKREIQGIEDRLDSPKFGLKEIKREVREIEEKLDWFLFKKKDLDFFQELIDS
jgi:hypothetical protein